jgi:hypothetical protein
MITPANQQALAPGLSRRRHYACVTRDHLPVLVPASAWRVTHTRSRIASTTAEATLGAGVHPGSEGRWRHDLSSGAIGSDLWLGRRGRAGLACRRAMSLGWAWKRRPWVKPVEFARRRMDGADANAYSRTDRGPNPVSDPPPRRRPPTVMIDAPILSRSQSRSNTHAPPKGRESSTSASPPNSARHEGGAHPTNTCYVTDLSTLRIRLWLLCRLRYSEPTLRTPKEHGT